MGISVGSFAIAGGLVLLVLSIKYMTTGRMMQLAKDEMVAVAPIGTPLTVGPATITTLLLLATQFPVFLVLMSFALNMLIAWAIFMIVGRQIARFLEQGGLKTVSRAFSPLLAAIAVTMIISGLEMLNIFSI